MLATVAAVVLTHNLAIGVLLGVLLSGLFFASKVAQIFRVTSTLSPAGRGRSCVGDGQVFVGSAENFLKAVDFRAAVETVRIDVGRAHIWDLTGVGALDTVILKFRREGAEVEVTGMNEAGATLV